MADVVDIKSRGVADVDLEDFVENAKIALEDMIRRSSAHACALTVVGADGAPLSLWRSRVTMTPSLIIGALEFTKQKVFRDCADDIERFEPPSA